MRVEVSLAPALYGCRTIKENHVTVVIDVLRATTAVCAAFQAGCSEVRPVEDLSTLPQWRSQGYLLAAERGGKKVGDAEYGNSPTEYLKHDLTGVRLAYSTTNGTRALLLASDACLTVAGCFANLSALAERLVREQKDVVVLCSGWEGDFCLEDTLVAGALIERVAELLGGSVTESPIIHNDAAVMALNLWQVAKNDIAGFCEKASHVWRLRRLGADADVRFALQMDTCPVVPVLKNEILTL